MNDIFAKQLGCALVFTLLVGCSDKTVGGLPNTTGVKDSLVEAAGGIKPLVPPKIDTSTPDFALKSWWAYLDELASFDARSCERSVSERSQFRKTESLLLTGDPLAWRTLDSAKCRVTKIDRQIKKVHMETETRSVIEVVMKDPVGPKPDERVPSYAKNGVENGYQLRYVLVKTAEGWRIEDVQEWDENNVYLKRDPWKQMYKIEPKSYFFDLGVQ